MKKFKLGKLLTTVCALLTFVMVFAFAACNSDDNNGGGGTSNGLTLNQSTLTIDAGDDAQIFVTSTVSQDVVWTSSDTSKVTVTGTNSGNRVGMIHAVAIGTATVTATSGDNFATCTINVVEAETITITQDGSAVPAAGLTLNADATLQLAATSSRGHAIEWESNKPLIASVSETGLVTALASSGTVTITAKCAQHSDVTATVQVVIGSGTDAAYDLKQGDETPQYGNDNSNEDPGVWYYWNQFNNLTVAKYEEGIVTLETAGVDEGAWWYNVQIFYTATENDKDVAGNALVGDGQHYKVTFDLDTTMGGHITVNGYPLIVADGMNHCTVYYDHYLTAFAMQLGQENFGCDLTNATLKLSNIKWEVSEKIQLEAPSFSITDNVITINDSNPAGSVGSYTLNLYDSTGKSVGGTIVEPGKKIDTSKISPNGTYTGKLTANAANAHYITAPEATSTNASVVVNNEHVVYPMQSSGAGGAISEKGTWTYWTESWVTFNGQVTDDVAKITFSNNSGNWYDTQLFYKVPGKANGDNYTLKLYFDNVPKSGRVTINNVVYTLKAGTNDPISLSITEGAMSNGTTLTIVFGVDGENNAQEIQTATDMLVWVEVVK